MTAVQKELLNGFDRDLVLYRKSIDVLAQSYKKCKSIDLSRPLSADQLEAFDALTSRFARSCDLFTQRILGLLDRIELEQPGTAVDRIHRAEKRGLISSAPIFMEIRELRNQISHEYEDDDIGGLFARILELAPHLIETINPLSKYSLPKR
ncbi:MAG TPA: hypothetical protein VKS81_02900 [Bacteroidota bacterium]|nr:hypothetical protein [Bacteroidota bacterium]